MPKSAKEASERALFLRHEHTRNRGEMRKIRALMDGGRDAVLELLGDVEGVGDHLPAANLALSGLSRLGQKLGKVPQLRVDPPANRESQRAHRSAEKLERIVAAYDEHAWMDQMLPMVGRWLPGYAFVPFVLQERRNPDGFRYPHTELRDPYDCFPAPWAANQQPEDMAVFRRVPVDVLDAQYPGVKQQIERQRPQARSGGGVLLDRGPGATGMSAQSDWENPSGTGVEVVEYYDDDAFYLLLPGYNIELERVDNVLTSGPQFVVAKRHAFNRLVGQYDHVIGLMSMQAKLNLLAQVGIEDETFKETNVYGDMPNGPYRRGRFAVNNLPQGTSVEVMGRNLPYQQFEQINRVERQLRTTAGYPVTDDAQSPNSYATGQGLEQLQDAVNNEVAEYQGVIRRHLQLLDAKRLEWDEKAYGGERKPLVGISKGEPFQEAYRPDHDINGRYRTRREHGMMAAWDDSQKIVGGLQLLSANAISTETFQENLDGLINVTRERERIQDEQAQQAILQMILTHASDSQSPEHQRALRAAVEMLPEGEFKDIGQQWLSNAEEEGEAISQELATQQAEQAAAGPGGAPPDVPTVLARLTQGGRASGGSQLQASVR